MDNKGYYLAMDERSKHLRRLIVRMVSTSKRGHIGPAFSMVEIFRVLYDSFLKYKPKNAEWHDRDICILSKGHGCLAHYAILSDKGFFPKELLTTFCEFESILGGHPDHKKVPGIEASTGSLGHGMSIGVGLAMAAIQNKKKRRIVVVLGDGELNEGSIWEAAMSASKHKLDNLILMLDCNGLQSYGFVDGVCRHSNV